jgi:hypothetical protein
VPENLIIYSGNSPVELAARCATGLSGYLPIIIINPKYQRDCQAGPGAGSAAAQATSGYNQELKGPDGAFFSQAAEAGPLEPFNRRKISG